MSQFILKDTFTFSNSQSYLIKINNKNRKQYNGLLITSLVAQTVKRLPTLQETRVQSLGWEDSPGEGNGSPLQYSCLENPMDLRAW